MAYWFNHAIQAALAGKKAEIKTDRRCPGCGSSEWHVPGPNCGDAERQRKAVAAEVVKQLNSTDAVAAEREAIAKFVEAEDDPILAEMIRQGVHHQRRPSGG